MRDYEREREKARAQLRAWLDGLKPGDEVVVEVRGRWHVREDVRKVTRRTARRIYLEPMGAEKEGRASAEDGGLVGGRGKIRPCTLADRLTAERARLLLEVATWADGVQRDPSKVPLEVLRAVAAAIKGGGGS